MMEPAEEEGREAYKPSSPGEYFGILVTNIIKLGGVVVAIDEVLVQPVIRPGALGIAALMMAGAQSLETFLTTFFNTGKK
jgi:hypothetical protein